MSRRKESIPYMLVHDVSWWVSVVLAAVAYGLMNLVAPNLWQDNPLLGNIMKAMPGCSGLAAMGLLCLAGLNLCVRLLKRMTQHPRATPSPNDRRDERPGTDAAPACPACGGPMVRRVARRGANPGAHFGGCACYPACEGTRPA